MDRDHRALRGFRGWRLPPSSRQSGSISITETRKHGMVWKLSPGLPSVFPCFRDPDGKSSAVRRLCFWRPIPVQARLRVIHPGNRPRRTRSARRMNRDSKSNRREPRGSQRSRFPSLRALRSLRLICPDLRELRVLLRGSNQLAAFIAWSCLSILFAVITP